MILKYKARIAFSVKNKFNVEVEAENREIAIIKLKEKVREEYGEEYGSKGWLIIGWEPPDGQESLAELP